MILRVKLNHAYIYLEASLENWNLNKAYRENMYSTHFHEQFIEDYDNVKTADMTESHKQINAIKQSNEA